MTPNQDSPNERAQAFRDAAAMLRNGAIALETFADGTQVADALRVWSTSFDRLADQYDSPSAPRPRAFNREDLAARFMLALLQGRSGDTLFDMATIESARSLGVESASMLAVELADALISRLDKGKPE